MACLSEEPHCVVQTLPPAFAVHWEKEIPARVRQSHEGHRGPLHPDGNGWQAYWVGPPSPPEISQYSVPCWQLRLPHEKRPGRHPMKPRFHAPPWHVQTSMQHTMHATWSVVHAAPTTAGVQPGLASAVELEVSAFELAAASVTCGASRSGAASGGPATSDRASGMPR